MKIIIQFLSLLLVVSVSKADSLEPVHIDTLFADADFVGIVQVTSGILGKDGATYEGKVITFIKGNTGTTEIQFGRFSGLRIGYSYLVFLEKDSSDHYEVMFNGFGEMAIESTQLIQDVNYIVEHPIPDQVVKIATSHVLLPKSLQSYPVDTSTKVWSPDKIWDMKWVRVADMIEFLQKLQLEK